MTANLNIYCDGGSRGNPGLAASAFIVQENNGNMLFEFGKNLGVTTNNVAEYNAVLEAYVWLEENNYLNANIAFFLDSQLVVNQLNGIYKIRDKDLINLAKIIKQKEMKFYSKITYTYIPREKNIHADLLVNKTLDKKY